MNDEQWQRLDPRMLLVHPIREVIRFLPVLVGVFVAGSAAGGGQWQLLGIGIPVGLGLLRYLTTSFRITAARVELRRGLLNRHVLSTPMDRVRTVDLTASPIHRLLGLTTVRVGTGTASTDADDRLDLDGLPTERARRLREELLHATSAIGDRAPAEPNDRVVLRLDPSWIRFAPLTSSGLVIVAGVLGVTSQALDSIGWYDHLDLGGLAAGADGTSLWVAVPLGLVALAVGASAMAIGGYLVTNWGFTLTHFELSHTGNGSWHLHRGLFTTRETSLDDERVSGVRIAEPLGLRLAGGGRLSAIVTGLDRKQQGSSVLVPPAPRGVVAGVAREVIGVAGPVDAPLTGHGPRARTRRFTRALTPALALALTALLWVVLGDAPGWLLLVAVLAPTVAAALAVDRARALGHLLTDGYVVARSGSLNRHRDVLAVGGVIGWNFRSTWFQRRAGLTTLSATTAGGPQSVTVLDVPEASAVLLAASAVPGLVEQFTVSRRDRAAPFEARPL
ncbi:MAG TPA: PH domain-containing protein [Nocardioides sp.]|nr:PH domain-containing protein [Nocardioides sp.]